MNMSIRKQLTIIFISLMAAMFLANFLASRFFLEDFYYVRKQEVLVKAYRLLNEDLDEMGRIDDESVQELTDLCRENGITYLVTDMGYNEILGTESDFYAGIMKGRLNGYGIGVDTDDVDVLETNESYTIQKKYDTEIGINYLEMWGVLERGFPFILRINIESISDSVRVSSLFMGYICLLAAILAAVIIWFVTKQVTKPLGELTELSKRMAALDFNAKYTSGGTNEIGQLGANFNEMSEALERAYAQLLTANNELQKDIEKKQQIDDMRREFLSNVSHELKTPIALIQGYAEGLEECVNDDEESREFYCEVIMDEASKMNSLVQQLLALTQLESGNDEVKLERFDLALLIRNKIQAVSILAQQKGAEITYLGNDSIYAWGDEFKIEEVLNNYLSNAINHVSGDNKIIVTARIRSESAASVPDPDSQSENELHFNSNDQTNLVRVTVFNTGEQIPEEDIGQIWDKFYKVDKARTREYGGSGVGLSIVKAIMDSHHQAYGAENRGDGVAFWFELRCSRASAEEAGTDNDREMDGEWIKVADKNARKERENGSSGRKNQSEESGDICDGEWRPDD